MRPASSLGDPASVLSAVRVSPGSAVSCMDSKFRWAAQRTRKSSLRVHSSPTRVGQRCRHPCQTRRPRALGASAVSTNVHRLPVMWWILVSELLGRATPHPGVGRASAGQRTLTRPRVGGGVGHAGTVRHREGAVLLDGA
jgi:hypothetical protein